MEMSLLLSQRSEYIVTPLFSRGKMQMAFGVLMLLRRKGKYGAFPVMLLSGQEY